MALSRVFVSRCKINNTVIPGCYEPITKIYAQLRRLIAEKPTHLHNEMRLIACISLSAEITYRINPVYCYNVL